MQVSAIVLAGGLGLRLRTKISKPLIKLNHKPIITYCLDSLSNHPCVSDIIVVANSSNSKGIINKIRKYRIGKVKDVVLGGARRQDSVINGLRAMDAGTDLVLIHDAARPFVDKKAVSLLLKEAQRYGAAIVGVPVKATIKKVHSPQCPSVHSHIVEKTLDRDTLWEIQTPQVFKKNLILDAYKKFGNTDATDDASLVEKLGRKVRIVMGSRFNIKITTPEDLILAEAILGSYKL